MTLNGISSIHSKILKGIVTVGSLIDFVTVLYKYFDISMYVYVK